MSAKKRANIFQKMKYGPWLRRYFDFNKKPNVFLLTYSGFNLGLAWWNFIFGIVYDYDKNLSFLFIILMFILISFVALLFSFKKASTVSVSSSENSLLDQ